MTVYGYRQSRNRSFQGDLVISHRPGMWQWRLRIIRSYTAMHSFAAMRGVRITTDYCGTSAAWRVRRMGSSLAGGALGCSARLCAGRCRVCGVRCAAGGPSFRGAELYVASGGAEHGLASRAIRLAAEGFAADGQCPLDIRGADAIVGHEPDQVRAVCSAEQSLLPARGHEPGCVHVLQPDVHDVRLDPAEVAVNPGYLGQALGQ